MMRNDIPNADTETNKQANEETKKARNVVAIKKGTKNAMNNSAPMKGHQYKFHGNPLTQITITIRNIAENPSNKLKAKFAAVFRNLREVMLLISPPLQLLRLAEFHDVPRRSVGRFKRWQQDGKCSGDVRMFVSGG